jgi:hypothetical protein
MALQLKMILNYANFIGKNQASNDFYTFEPRNLKEKIIAINHNMKENWTVIASVFLAFYLPSLISIGFMVLTFNLTISGQMEAVHRIKWATRFMYLNIATLVFIVGWKMRKI